MVDLSVVIPVYNAMPLLERCLDSVFGQTTRYAVEVILVDDGSTDASVDYIRSRKEPNLVLHRQANAGPAAARNKGVELAQGRYCAYLDADDYWMDGYVEQTVAFLEKHSDVVAVNTAQIHKSVSGESVVPANYKSYKSDFVLDDFYQFWAEYNHVCTGSVLMRTDAVRRCGGMREDLRSNEDWEFWAVLASCGRWGFLPEALFVSDGADVTKNNGWLNKMEKRWRLAVPTSIWQKRIEEMCPQILQNLGFVRKRGQIACDIAYSLLLSDRIKEARKEALTYGEYFTKSPIGKLMNVAKIHGGVWWIMAKMLKYREYHRKV